MPEPQLLIRCTNSLHVQECSKGAFSLRQPLKCIPVKLFATGQWFVFERCIQNVKRPLSIFFHSHIMLSSYLLLGLVASTAQTSALERRLTVEVSGKRMFNSNAIAD